MILMRMRTKDLKIQTSRSIDFRPPHFSLFVCSNEVVGTNHLLSHIKLASSHQFPTYKHTRDAPKFAPKFVQSHLEIEEKWAYIVVIHAKRMIKCKQAAELAKTPVKSSNMNKQSKTEVASKRSRRSSFRSHAIVATVLCALSFVEKGEAILFCFVLFLMLAIRVKVYINHSQLGGAARRERNEIVNYVTTRA